MLPLGVLLCVRNVFNMCDVCMAETVFEIKNTGQERRPHRAETVRLFREKRDFSDDIFSAEVISSLVTL